MGSNGRLKAERSVGARKQLDTPQAAPRAARAALAAKPSRDGLAQRAAQDVEGLKGYQLGDCLGKGAFGSVYRALHWGSGETVAIKQIKLTDLPRNEIGTIMLEIDLLKNLNHPNIVKYHGFVKSAESLYIILEYCENGSLHSICKNFGKFPENLVALYMSQVLYGMIYLHEQGVIHRDIKGANILTTKEGLAKLADFGVATKASGLSEASVVGTPYWMAPEVIELSGATTASDIWSLGCTVIELLDGKPPYYQLQPMPALFRIVNDDHPPLPEGASPGVRDFLMQCFQKDPNLRVSAKKLLKHPWIVSAKKADSIVPSMPTKYDQVVKTVQEWNEALKSPNGSFKRTSRIAASSPGPSSSKRSSQLIGHTSSKEALKVTKTRPNPDQFRSPDHETDDNWDADFASSISASALRLPHLRPHDNFAGRLSAERLKSYARTDQRGSELSTFTQADLDRSSFNLHNADPLETVKPVTPGRNRSDKSAGQPETKSQRRPSHPRPRIHPILAKPSPPILVPPTTAPVNASSTRPAAAFREDSVEDYSDLIANDDGAFERRIQSMRNQESDSFSPKLFHPSDLKNMPRSTQNVGRRVGSLRRNPLPLEEMEPPQMHRSGSSVEIQKYAEADEEDFSDIFGNTGSILPVQDSDSGSDQSTLMMLNSKFATNSWLVDEEDEDDPFAQLEEGFDEVDLQTNVARDRHARLCTSVESLVSSLKTSQPDDVLADISDELMELLYESPDLKNVIITSHGMLPILEILENSQRMDVIIRLLKIVNMIIHENTELQENLCFVGGIPILSKFAHRKYSSEIRLEAAAFVRQMYQTSTLTLQMFISCGGLNVLVEFLEEDLDTERDLVLIGVNGVWSVFELQGPTPKNDFCRIFSRSSILYPLSLVLNRVLDEDDEVAELVEGRIVNIFLLFSQAESYVKETVADRMVLKRILKDLRRMSPQHQITMLKFIKNLSMLSTTHDALQNSNAIEALTDLLSASMKLPHSREVSNQVLNIMYNLCRLSKTRQEDAALSGIIPLLQEIVQTERPLKEFALPILCDMAHSGKVGRKLLWQNKGLQFYISLLADKYWQVTALEAIHVWLQEETARVEQHLLERTFGEAIIDCFVNPEVSTDAFEQLLEPLLKLFRLSPPVAGHLAHPNIFARTAQKLHTKKAVVRLNLIRILRCICDAVPYVEEELRPSSHDGVSGSPSSRSISLLRAYGIYDAIAQLADSDPAVLVREMASDLIQRSDEQVPLPGSRSESISVSGGRLARPPGMRRSSSSTSTVAMNSPASKSATPHSLRSPVGAIPSTYFDSNSLGIRSRAHAGSGSSTSSLYNGSLNAGALGTGSAVFRPTSRDGSGVSTSQARSNSGESTASSIGPSGSSSNSGLLQLQVAKSRLPRTSIGGVGSSSRRGRLSLAGTPSIREARENESKSGSKANPGGSAPTAESAGKGRREKAENTTPTHSNPLVLRSSRALASGRLARRQTDGWH